MEMRFLSPPEQEYQCHECDVIDTVDKMVIYQSGIAVCLDCIDVLYPEQEVKA